MAPSFHRPARLDEALAALAERPRTVLAGGTDVYPGLVGRPEGDLDVLDITGVAELRGVTRAGGAWRLGALTRWSDVARGDLPPVFAGLRQAARDVGGPQIQNAGTIGGNLCNASPAADAVPNLLALGASVELASARRGARRLPLDAFVLGNRRTALEPDELLTAILVPAPLGAAWTNFRKLGARRHLVISIVMAAVALELEEDRIVRAGVAVGACSPAARRLGLLEERLTGERFRPGLERAVDDACLAPLSPIDDIRATGRYRLDACLTLLRRALAGLVAPDDAALAA